MPKIDLSPLTQKELEALSEDVTTAIQDRRAATAESLAAEIRSRAESEGVSVNDVLANLGEKRGVGKGRAKTKLAAKYRHPQDQSLTWSGRGKKPKWITQFLADGKSLESLQV